VGSGFGVEDLAGLLRGAGEAFGDEVEEAGDVLEAAAGVSACLDAGTTHGRISSGLKNDGAADLNIHATTAHGDITARSL
jgi:hypothetical protein